MKEHPMLMKGPLIIATLNDSKTQTRRLPTSATARVDGKHVSPKAWKALDLDWDHAQIDGRAIRLPERNRPPWHILTPIWEAGDHLWLRESFAVDDARGDDSALSGHAGPVIFYRATDHETCGQPWKPSIHMPRWASRIDLEVLAVRAERIQDISNGDIRAEGVSCPEHDGGGCFCTGNCAVLGGEWVCLWDSINAARGSSWSTNRPVFVLTYKRIRP